MVSSSTVFAEAAKAARPNVVIFLMDDLSWQEHSVYGWSKIPTPNFDRVAREGALFTRAYCSAPSCAPSRATLLTGRNFWELEQGAFIQAWLPDKFATLPALLDKGGYLTGFSGKGWGPGVSTGEGRHHTPAGQPYNGIKRPQAEREPGINDIDYPANFAKFLNARRPGQPFWFWLGSTEPHAPCDRENYKKLEARYGIGLDAIKVPSFLPDTPGVRRARANMLYEVCRADEDLGRLLKILEERQLLTNTLVIVTADNGTDTPRSKTNLYDWGVHEPLAMMWPACIKPGRRIDDFVNFADFAPTILEAAGLPVSPEMTGRSLLKILQSPANGRIDPERSFTVCGLEWHGEFDPVNLAGRTLIEERYHYIVNYGAGPRLALSEKTLLPADSFEESRQKDTPMTLLHRHFQHPALASFLPLLVNPRPPEELYDTQTDPWELKNLADSPEHAGIKAKLKAQLEAVQRRTHDPRITGDMKIFEQTRAFVQGRKQNGYEDK